MSKNRNPAFGKNGEENLSSKLTEQDVLYIRSVGLIGKQGRNGLGGNCQELAKQFNVSSVAIRKILLRKTWKHI
jgi:hypothetical protein